MSYLISQQLASPSSSQASFNWRFPDITDDTDPAPARLKLNNMYYLRVRAVSDIGEGNWSDVSMKVFVRSPGAPTGLVANVSGLLSFNVSWTAPLELGAGPGVYYGSVLYDYALYEASNSNPTVTATVDQSTTTLYLPNLTKNTRYYMRVRARNDATFESDDVTFAEAGDWSNEYTVVAKTAQTTLPQLVIPPHICSKGWFTEGCNVSCDRHVNCSANGRCLGETGECVCNDGFSGPDCAEALGSSGC
eukprot:3223702-Rhodomonas_salina.1